MEKLHISNLSKSAEWLRKKVCKHSFFLFVAFYFPQLFKFKIPDFHKLWYQMLMFRDPKTSKRFKFLVLMAFRDSAKTSLAKIKIIYNICYKRKRLISYVCFEKDKSGEALFDIATWLQTNKKLIKDFGMLYKPMDGSGKGRPEQKSIGNFVTTNGVRVTAFGIRQDVRGRNYDLERPDCYVCDDFENLVTKTSAALTRKTINFFKTMIAGLTVDAEVIFVCNYLSDTGSVQWLLDTAMNNPAWRVCQKALLEPDEKGHLQIVWPARYALTDAEAEKFNASISDKRKHKTSIESIKRDMNADGKLNFEQEYLNQPLVEGERFFDTKKIDERIAILQAVTWQDKDPKKPLYFARRGSWKVWGEWKKESRNVIAADVSEGYGLDSSVLECFDLNTGFQLKEYESNSCPPSALAVMMVNEGIAAGNALLMPERNSIGVAVVDGIKAKNYLNIFREKTVDKTTEGPVHKFGWHTNSKTKPLMLFDFKRAFENGEIILNSIPLLREMRAFTNGKITEVTFDPEASHHFDRVMAAAIAWQARGVLQYRGVK